MEIAGRHGPKGCAAGVRHALVDVHCAPPTDCPGGRHPPTCKTDCPPRRLGRCGALGPAVILAPAPTHGAAPPPPPANGCNSGCSSPGSRTYRIGSHAQVRTPPNLREPQVRGLLIRWFRVRAPGAPLAMTCGFSPEQGPASNSRGTTTRSTTGPS